MLRRRMMLAQGGVSLPAGYTKIEYLESDGSQFIDTGFKPNNNTRVVMDAMVADGNQDWIALFGAREADYTNCFSCFATGSTNPTPNKLYPNIGDKFDVEYLDVDIYSRHKYDVNKNVVSVDGVVLHTFTARTFTNSLNIFIFSNNDAGSPSFQHKVRIWSCKIYDNGVLVRDLIPCTNPDGISGLWDSVNDVFYKLLPADYTRLDFIETDGTTYINTGFKPNQDTRVVMDAKSTIIPAAGDNRCWFGARVSGTYYEMYAASSKDDIVGFIYGSGTQHKFDIDWSIRHTLEINKNIGRIDNEIVTGAVQTFSIPHNIYLCADNAAGTPKACLPMMLYSCQIYDNGTLVRDFTPAMNASGEAGLYDLKNDVWYALKPVVTKTENKITFNYYLSEYEHPFTGVTILETVITIYSTYAITSDLDITFEGTNPNNPTKTFKILKGITQYRVGESLFGIPTLTSISPTEDDTYIYTF